MIQAIILFSKRALGERAIDAIILMHPLVTNVALGNINGILADTQEAAEIVHLKDVPLAENRPVALARLDFRGVVQHLFTHRFFKGPP